jgi:hypothetical protein
MSKSLASYMKISPRICLATGLNWLVQTVRSHSLVLVLALITHTGFGATQTNQTFSTPEEAVAVLVAAADKPDSDALHNIFGAAAPEMESPDRVQAANEQNAFARSLNQGTQIVRESDSRCVVEVGDRHWPFPIPIVKKDGRWFFDTAAGKEEVLNRRIGKDELSTIQVLRGCVDAQREYAAEDRDGDDVLEFAQKFTSTPGNKDGLYWSPELDGEMSPLGPLVAKAQRLGYGKQPQDAQAGEPFHGYYFKILTRQGAHAPGGKYDYIINGNMIAGFAFVAWPASYGQSGVMTFIVNQQGRVYQKDLGPKTDKLVEEMKEYDPDKTWTESLD